MNEVSIYFPEEESSLFHYHIDQFISRQETGYWTFFHDINTFINSARGKKIACFQIPMPYSDKIENQIDVLYDTVDSILVLGTELHNNHVNFIQRYDLDKVHWFLCGYLNFELAHSAAHLFLSHFLTASDFYKRIKPELLDKLTPFIAKPFTFDALLGCKRDHRDFVYKFVNENSLTSGITTYKLSGGHLELNSDDPSIWRWESEGLDNFEEAKQKKWTVDTVKYYGYPICISQILPITIYNQTAYSLICETNALNHFVFFTEKTVKPILAKRLFITIAGRYSLARLRELGFKTFHGIIDEGYDEIESTTDRYSAAMEQLAWLCEQDQLDILLKCRDSIEHNFNLMYNNDWYRLFKEPFSRQFLGPGQE